MSQSEPPVDPDLRTSQEDGRADRTRTSAPLDGSSTGARQSHDAGQAPGGWADPMWEVRRVLNPLRKRWSSYRNSNLKDRRFHDRAAKFPLTRPFAQRDSRRLFDLVAGFVYSQILSAGIDLNLFDHLSERPLTVDEIARRISLEPDATLRLLRASVSLDLVEIEEGFDDPKEPGKPAEHRYGLGPLGAAVVANPGIAAMVRHHDAFYDDMKDPIALLRGEGGPTKLSKLWPYAGGKAGEADPEATKRYSELMAASQEMVAREIINSYDLTWARSIIDIGGGSGRFLATVAKVVPDAELTLFDLPNVAPLARESLAKSRNGRRIDVIAGDFMTDDLPSGYDLATLVRILHDHDDSTVVELLAKIRKGLRPGGVVMVAEPMAGDRHSRPVADAYFGFYLLAMGSGRPRSAEEIGRLMNTAGLHRAREVKTTLPVVTRIMLAEVPRPSRAELAQRSVPSA